MEHLKPHLKIIFQTVFAWAAYGIGNVVGDVSTAEVYMKLLNLGLQSLAYLASIGVAVLTILKIRRDLRKPNNTRTNGK